MSEIQFNPQLQPAVELTDEQLNELAKKREYLQAQATDLIAINCTTTTHDALAWYCGLMRLKIS